MTPTLTIHCGDALAELRKLPSESVHMCVTSPPYWGLRDYGTAKWEGGNSNCSHAPRSQVDGATASSNRGCLRDKPSDVCKCGARRVDRQLGLERTPEEYVAKMVEVFREVRRVLRSDGTCWVNCGDTYAGGGRGGNPDDSPFREQATNAGSLVAPSAIPSGLKPKDLCGIPWRLAFALQADGWWLRQDIIWHKKSPMPESVTDRCCKAHEYLFLLAKSARYYFDSEAIKEPLASEPESWGRHSKKDPGLKALTPGAMFGPDRDGRDGTEWGNGATRTKRSVWTTGPSPHPEAHFATYPPNLIKPCILAGTSARGCCPKCGGPWDRILSSERRYDHVTTQAGKSKAGPYADQTGNGKATHDVRHGVFSDTKTTGWTPTCICGETETVPTVVLDPFFGSGTTGQVALELGRSVIGIELNPAYVKLAERRCCVTPGLRLA